MINQVTTRATATPGQPAPTEKTRSVGRIKKLVIALMGGTVFIVGLALLVLPGPGIPIILAGLAILAQEFIWAQRMMRQANGVVAKAEGKLGRGGKLARWCADILRRLKPKSHQQGSSSR